jgi:pimeloyl-ACP methyl ester carboxylesterase
MLMDDSTMATTSFVLVHGAAHGGWCWRRVARLLREAGHDVYTPTLTGLGERSHLVSGDVDLDTHITDIVNVLHYEDLHDVVLAGHGYGRMVITGVGDRAADRVGRLVYIDGRSPKNGQSLVDLSWGSITETREHAEIVGGVELVLLPTSTPASSYGVTAPDDVAWMTDRLTGHPWKCFEQPIRLANEGAPPAIPIYDIVSTHEMLARANAEGRHWTIDTGHDVMITEAQIIADSLLQIAAD